MFVAVFSTKGVSVMSGFVRSSSFSDWAQDFFCCPRSCSKSGIVSVTNDSWVLVLHLPRPRYIILFLILGLPPIRIDCSKLHFRNGRFISWSYLNRSDTKIFSSILGDVWVILLVRDLLYESYILFRFSLQQYPSWVLCAHFYLLFML